MTVRVGINGFGRIGRGFMRALLQSDVDVQVAGINDITDAATLASLLEWDSLYGHLDGISADGEAIVVNGQKIPVFAVRNPAEIPWGSVGADVIVESTGLFTDGDKAREHLKGGAKKVIISAPASGDVPAVVLGVNDEVIASAADVISNGSCTTNSLAPMAKVLQEKFGIESGIMTTVHAYTSDQRLQDAPHKDLRRARAAALSTIPTSSGAAKTIGKIIPALDGKLTGLALRVPVPVGSITDFTVKLSKPATKEEINAAFAEAAADPAMERYMKYSEAPIVSHDIVADPHSVIVDAPLTEVVGDQVKVFGWYDNEWGFSHRMVELAAKFGA